MIWWVIFVASASLFIIILSIIVYKEIQEINKLIKSIKRLEKGYFEFDRKPEETVTMVGNYSDFHAVKSMFCPYDPEVECWDNIRTKDECESYHHKPEILKKRVS